MNKKPFVLTQNCQTVNNEDLVQCTHPCSLRGTHLRLLEGGGLWLQTAGPPTLGWWTLEGEETLGGSKGCSDRAAYGRFRVTHAISRDYGDLLRVDSRSLEASLGSEGSARGAAETFSTLRGRKMATRPHGNRAEKDNGEVGGGLNRGLWNV